MTVVGSQDERIEALRSLLERLGSPELTLTEATGLRSQLFDLLGSDDGPAGVDGAGSAPAVVRCQTLTEGSRRETW